MRLVFGLLAAGALLVASPVLSATLRVSSDRFVADIDPHGPNSVVRDTIMVGRQVYEPLVEFHDNEAVGRLATAWEQVNETTWRFTVREGVAFHDGTMLDAEDVAASVRRQAAATGGLARLWGQLDSVEVIDPQTVQINLKEPVGSFLRNVSMLQIVPSEAIAALGDEYGAAVKLPGTGPFKIKSFEPSLTVELEAFAGHWDGAPAIDGVSIRTIPQLAGRITALLNNEIDLTWNIPDDQLASVQSSPDVTVELVPSVIYLYSWFNSGREPFNDARVRQALWHAIDVKQVVADLLPQTGTVAQAPVASTVFGWVPQEPYSYDPELAKKLLAEAGYPNGITGEIIYSPTDPILGQFAQTYAAYWEAIGASIRPTQLEPAIFGEAFRSLNWDIMISTNPTYTQDADYTLGRLYISPEGVNEENGWVNPEANQLLMAAKSEPDQAKRLELYGKASAIIWGEAAGIFPAELKAVYAYRNNVSGIELSPTLTPRFRDVTIQ